MEAAAVEAAALEAAAVEAAALEAAAVDAAALEAAAVEAAHRMWRHQTQYWTQQRQTQQYSAVPAVPAVQRSGGISSNTAEEAAPAAKARWKLTYFFS